MAHETKSDWIRNFSNFVKLLVANNITLMTNKDFFESKSIKTESIWKIHKALGDIKTAIRTFILLRSIFCYF